MKTLLIVDDEWDLIDALKTFLEPEGFDVLSAVDGTQALEIIRSAAPPPDLILLDLMMPEVDGFEVLSFLKGHDIYREVPVLIMSATYARSDSEELSGIPFLRKPFDLTELMEKIRETLK